MEILEIVETTGVVEIDDVERKGKALSSVRKSYQCAMTDNWEDLKQLYKDNVMGVVERMTTKNDTGLHVAGYAGRNDVVEFLISLTKESEYYSPWHALITENHRGNTPLHEVAASGNLDAAKLLVETADAFDRKEESSASPELVEIKNQLGETPHYRPAAFDRDVESSYVRLVEIKNHLGETPLYRAAAFGHTKMVQYLAKKVGKHIGKHFQRKVDRVSILHIAVLGQHFETAHWLVTKYPDLAKRKEKNGLTSLQLLAQMPSAFKPKFRESIWIKLHRHICLCNDDDIDRDQANQNRDLESGFNQPSQSTFSNKIMRTIRRTTMGEEMQNQNELLKLTDFLVNMDYSWAQTDPNEVVNTFSLVSKPNIPQKKKDAETKSTYEYIPLFIATRTGISQIVEKILKFHPQAVEAHDIKHQQNILHMAIKYRRLAIFNIVKKNNFINSRLADMIDSNGNTILHHAADMSYYTDMSYYSVDAKGTYGPAFQLQEELHWMARVQKIIPAYYTMHHNNNGVTAEELFSSQHAELLQSAKAWIKETAQSGSVVAALVATVAYAAAYTVPGGTNQNGLPNLQHSPFFKAFTISNTVSLIFSLTSLGTFLNIMRSPFEYKNFHHSLPFKLNLGFLLLFCSLLVSMLSFAATIVLLIHHQKIWSISLIYVVVAILPFSVFGLNHNRFYDVFFKGWKYIKKKLRCCKRTYVRIRMQL